MNLGFQIYLTREIKSFAHNGEGNRYDGLYGYGTIDLSTTYSIKIIKRSVVFASSNTDFERI